METSRFAVGVDATFKRPVKLPDAMLQERMFPVFAKKDVIFPDDAFSVLINELLTFMNPMFADMTFSDTMFANPTFMDTMFADVVLLNPVFIVPNVIPVMFAVDAFKIPTFAFVVVIRVAINALC